MVMSLLRSLLLFYFSFNELTTAADILWVKTGEKVTMMCSTTLKDQDGMYLYVGLDRDREVLYYYQRDSKLTPRKRYWDRVKTEGPMDQLTITISNLTTEDTGVYWCVYTKFNEATYENYINQGRGSTLVVVNGRYDALQLPCPTATAVTLTTFHPANEKPCPSGVESIIIIITIILTTLICAFIFLVWVAPLVKRCCNRRGYTPQVFPDSVYEDMARNHIYPPGTQQVESYPYSVSTKGGSRTTV
ncbi:uncharacterized protein LOC116374879 isoform X2 [Oncorhynchus kisutch]|uniref:uncharacterized protein LOC109893018 isoform X2 n=1 Tax=Oncorhynchus kisutch TaxID=8019 RepID=UPI00099FC9F5|nr:uncharacterized protein LOC109893018 isoform X2 [Oncorhynchus kisutch]XP_031686954.1 uncharacterized protein LOC116374879 isoform X2 [Oncorhynchus kisutch]